MAIRKIKMIVEVDAAVHLGQIHDDTVLAFRTSGLPYRLVGIAPFNSMTESDELPPPDELPTPVPVVKRTKPPKPPWHDAIATNAEEVNLVVLNVMCLRCGAERGMACSGKGAFVRAHRRRVYTYRQLTKWRVYA